MVVTDQQNREKARGKKSEPVCSIKAINTDKEWHKHTHTFIKTSNVFEATPFLAYE